MTGAASTATASATRDERRAALRAVVPLLGELNDLKRIRPAGLAGSLAADAFRRGWGALLEGADPGAVAEREAARAVAAARLGGIDAAVLARGGVDPDEAAGVLRDSFRAVSGVLSHSQRQRLESALAAKSPEVVELRSSPWWVERLAAQPRAGATKPGSARLVVDPPEDHAEHCATVALYAVLLSPVYGAEPAAPYLCGLAHHLHNAVLPDSGFAGEEILGARLAPVTERLTAEVLESLPSPLAATVADALALTAAAERPEARAFHAADVLDRVLQMRHHARAAAFTLDQALGEMELVHAGPLQPFHLEVLEEAAVA